MISLSILQTKKEVDATEIRYIHSNGSGGGIWTSRPPGYEPDELPSCSTPRHSIAFIGDIDYYTLFQRFCQEGSESFFAAEAEDENAAADLLSRKPAATLYWFYLGSEGDYSHTLRLNTFCIIYVCPIPSDGSDSLWHSYSIACIASGYHSVIRVITGKTALL